MTQSAVRSSFMALACFAALAHASGPLRAAPAGVAEPAGLWEGHMHGDTPATLAGAKVIDAATLAALQDRRPVMIDVAHSDSPADHASSDRPHVSIPGATWMPGAGSGSADPGFTAAFEKRLADLTGGDKRKPIVTFCHPRRWGSWNAAKRAVALGYRNVYWLPAGSEGWRASRKPAYLFEDPAWKAAFEPIKDRAPSRP